MTTLSPIRSLALALHGQNLVGVSHSYNNSDPVLLLAMEANYEVSMLLTKGKAAFSLL